MSSIPPTPSEPLPTPPPDGPIAPGSGLPVHVAAGLASLFTLPSGIFFFIMDRREPFVRFYAVQAMVIGGISVLMYIVHALITFILSWLWVLGKLMLPVFDFITALISLALLVVWAISTFCAFSGKMWRVPFLNAALKRYGSRLP